MKIEEHVMKIEELEVRLESYTGAMSSGVGKVEVPVRQERIFVNGVMAGYAPKSATGQISLVIQRVTPEIRDHIKREVDRQRGTISPGIVQVRELDEANVKVEAVETPVSASTQDVDLV